MTMQMATQATPSSSLTRYRPVVLSVVGFAAIYCAYLVYKTHHDNPPTSVGIHRSNAIHRPRRPQHVQRQREAPTSDAGLPPNPANGNDMSNLDTFPSYGRWEFENGDGQPAHVVLNPHFLPTIESLQREHRLSAAQAENILGRIQQEFVTRFLMVHFGRGADSSHRRSPTAWGAAASFLLERNIPSAVVEATLNHLRQALEAQLQDAIAVANERQLEHDNFSDVGTVLGTDDGAADLQSRFNGGGLHLKQLLYHVAESQARQEVLHRGFRCDSCNTTPIRGIRWKCSNCVDIDLCNDCHANSTHSRTHIFYEIRVPTYAMSNIHPVQEPSYLGRPQLMPQTLPSDVCKALVEKSGYEKAEIEGLYDQFTCIASTPIVHRKDRIGRAIDRDTFQKALHPLSSANQLRPNLIFDRLFVLFDTGSDGLVDFEEFVMGVVFIRGKSKSKNRRRKIFDAYDGDGDGFVSRKDFLRMFRAFFAIQKDISRDLLSPREIENGLRDAAAKVASSQTLSSAFTESRIPRVEPTQPGDKIPDRFGETRNQPTQRIVRPSVPNRVKRSEIVGHSWESQAQFPFDHNSGEPLSVRDFLFLAPRNLQGQPDHHLGRDQRVHFAYDGQPVANARKAAWKERWRRRRFYTDEEEGVRACSSRHGPRTHDYDLANGSSKNNQYGNEAKHERRTKDVEEPEHTHGPYHKEESNDEEGSRMDEILEVDFATDQSDNNHQQTLAHQRRARQIGDYQIPRVEHDLGQDVMFQVMEDALNELLDPLFKDKESLAIEVSLTRKERETWKANIEEFKEDERKKKEEADKIAQDPLMATAFGVAAEQLTQTEAVEKARPLPNGRVLGTASNTSRPDGEPSYVRGGAGPTSPEVPLADAVATGLVPVAEAIASVETQVNEQTLDELLDTTRYGFRPPPGETTTAIMGGTSNTVSSLMPEIIATRNVIVSNGIVGDESSGRSPEPLTVPPLEFPQNAGTVRFRELSPTSQTVVPAQTVLPPNFDPTMPQFRPNSDKELEIPARAADVTVDPLRQNSHKPMDFGSLPNDPNRVGYREQFEAEIVRQFEKMFLGWNRDKDGKVRNGAAEPGGRSGTTQPNQMPDHRRLQRLVELDEADLEIQARKGPGRLSFDEFENFLRSVKGNNFAFLENWLELCYF